MKEDFRAEQIGQPNSVAYRKETFSCSVEGKRITQEFENDLHRRLKNRVRRPMFGVKISNNHGKSWNLRALCSQCLTSIEPPTRCINEGLTGALTCDWCGAVNEFYQYPEKLKK